MKTVGLGLIALLFWVQSAWAGGGEYAPIVQGGINFHSGTTGKSLTGANAYFVTFRAEKRKVIFRSSIAADLSMASGEASVGAATPSFSMYGAGFLGGINAFLFTTGRLQPYMGGSAILSWNYMKLPTPPTSVEPNTQGLSIGYELGAGVDIRLGNQEGNAIRIHGGMWNVTSSSLAGVSGFELTGFRLSVGMVY